MRELNAARPLVLPVFPTSRVALHGLIVRCRGHGASRQSWFRVFFVVAAFLATLLLTPPQAFCAAKADTKAFNAYYANQSARIYDHLLKVTDYYASLAKDGNDDRIKDVLALRASLSACWELILNAGDMVYVYDVLDPGCSSAVNQLGGMIKTGLVTVGGKLDKELQWMRLVEKNVSDLPIAVQLGQAFRDIEAMAAYFRTAAPTFEPAAAGETRQSVKK
ncbi:MAG: hypothetical protein B193_0566 [Solidesulfovibrio magneticus str. Maddingley MBC34]|uniref:Uncharacterized protein n=1 Tax=Solidesulfovibrio magneticus str. Maddingley MBC34 TaxID=1206767 RepID=K6GUT2_9BACT|nr:MAG: hypothetical protein B193_0566 [Solidesulfovibrio magneticus str. Maddingley MBC34]